MWIQTCTQGGSYLDSSQRNCERHISLRRHSRQGMCLQLQPTGAHPIEPAAYQHREWALSIATSLGREEYIHSLLMSYPGHKGYFITYSIAFIPVRMRHIYYMEKAIPLSGCTCRILSAVWKRWKELGSAICWNVKERAHDLTSSFIH